MVTARALPTYPHAVLPPRTIGVLACVALLAGLAPSPVSAANDPGALARQIREASAELSQANAKVRRSLEALATVQERLDTARERLRRARAEEATARTEAAEATAAAASARAAIAAIKNRKREVQGRIDAANAQVGTLVRAIYQQGPLAQVSAVLEAKNPGELTATVAAVTSVVRTQETAQTELNEALADLRYEQQRERDLAAQALEDEQLAQKRLDDAEAARREAQDAAGEVADLVDERRDALADARSHRDDVAAELEELRKEQERLQRESEQASGASTDPAPDPGRGFTWPVSGARLTGLTGPRIHPVYGYRSCHTGIDLGAGSGTPIRATASGTVASVRNGGPYGLHTLITHGGGIASFYAHQSRTAVSPGERVREGEVIGYVGSTGWSTGPHLHFEIHVNGRPYDPRGWFGSAKRAVGC